MLAFAGLCIVGGVRVVSIQAQSYGARLEAKLACSRPVGPSEYDVAGADIYALRDVHLVLSVTSLGEIVPAHIVEQDFRRTNLISTGNGELLAEEPDLLTALAGRG